MTHCPVNKKDKKYMNLKPKGTRTSLMQKGIIISTDTKAIQEKKKSRHDGAFSFPAQTWNNGDLPYSMKSQIA